MAFNCAMHLQLCSLVVKSLLSRKLRGIKREDYQPSGLCRGTGVEEASKASNIRKPTFCGYGSMAHFMPQLSLGPYPGGSKLPRVRTGYLQSFQALAVSPASIAFQALQGLQPLAFQASCSSLHLRAVRLSHWLQQIS